MNTNPNRFESSYNSQNLPIYWNPKKGGINPPSLSSTGIIAQCPGRMKLLYFPLFFQLIVLKFNFCQLPIRWRFLLSSLIHQ
jgi:hypothetical protein